MITQIGGSVARKLKGEMQTAFTEENIDYTVGLQVVDPFQGYVYENEEYFPDPQAVPFETQFFPDELAAGKWKKQKKWATKRDVKDVTDSVNNLHTRRKAIEWRTGLKVTDPLQLYVHEGVEYLPSKNEVPFTTAVVFEVDKFNLSLKFQHWRFVGDIRGWGAVGDGNLDTNTGTDNTKAVQSCIDSSAIQGHPVFIPNGIFKCYGLLTWKKYSAPFLSNDKGQYLCGEGASVSVLLGDNKDFLDLAGTSIKLKDIQISCYGSSVKDSDGASVEFSGRILFDSSRPGNTFVSTEDTILARCGIAVDGSVGTYNNKYYRTYFNFCKVGVEGERAYGSTFESCDFICQTAIRALDTTVHAVSVRDCHFALGTYGKIFNTYERTIDILSEGITFFGRNYGETYDAVTHDSTFLRMGLNSTDNSIVEGLYLNLGQAADKWTPRELYVQQGYGDITTKTLFRNNRVNASNDVVQRWFTSTGDKTITMKEDEIPSHHTNIKLPDDYKVFTVDSYKAVFSSNVDVTSEAVLNFSTMQSGLAKVSDNRIVNSQGNLNMRYGAYKVIVGGRATLPENAIVTLEFGGSLKFNVVIGEDGYIGGSAMLNYTGANNNVEVKIRTGIVSKITFYGLTINLEKVS